MLKIGIPRGLYYYQYFSLWESFFKELNLEVKVSPDTNKNIINVGVQSIVDEICTPVKTYLGHVDALKDQVDYLFIPRIVSAHRGEYTCPKIMGLPDMVKANISSLPKIISPIIDLTNKNTSLYKSILEVGYMFTKNPLRILSAWQEALKSFKKYTNSFYSGGFAENLQQKQKISKNNSLNLVVLGHEYIIYDPYLSMNLIKKLQDLDINVYTPQMIDQEIVESEIKRLPKKMFWDFAKDLLGATFYLGKQQNIDGFIHISSFGCGPDAMTINTIATYLKKCNKPLLELTVDEHTGEAGINTRLEAFYDLLKRRVG